MIAQLLLDLSNDAIVIADESQTILLCNHNAAHLSGYSQSELIGMPLTRLLPERFQAGLGDHRQAMVRRKDGVEAPIIASIVKELHEGRPVLVVVMRDLGVEREDMLTLHSMARFPEENPNPLLRMLPDGTLLYANAHGRQFLNDIGVADQAKAPPAWIELAQRVMATGRQRDEIIHYGNRYQSCLFVPVLGAGYVNVYCLDITERMDAEAEHELTSGILDFIGNLILVANSEGLIQYISPSVQDILGYSPQEVLGDGWWEIIRKSGGNPEQDRAYVRRATMGEAPVDPRPYEHRLMHKDGSWRWLIIADAKGPRDYIFGIGTDVTDLKRAQAEAQAQGEFAQQLMNSMGQGLTVTTTDGAFEYVNPAYARILGTTPEEVIGKTPEDFTFPDDHVVLDSANRQRLQGQTSSYETRLRGADGREIYALITGVPRYRDGIFAGAIAVVTDLTERRQMETLLRQSEESIRELYETAAQQIPFEQKIQELLRMGIHRFGLDIGILSQVESERYTVMAVEPMSGSIKMGDSLEVKMTYSWDTLRANAPIEIVHAGASEWARHLCYKATHIEAYLGAPVIVAGNVYGTLSFTSLQPRLRPFTTVDKEFIRLMAQWIGAEIEREGATRRLRAYADEIERKNEALATARDKALEASRLKSEFLATMSHEIRTPMNAIIGMNEMLMDSGLTEEQREFAGIVGSSAQALLSILNDILDFSKIEAGKLLLDPETFNLPAILRKVVELFRHKAAEQSLEFDFQVEPGTPTTVTGDAGRLRQILSNLLSNAIKFTEKGAVRLQVSTAGLAAEGVINVRFEVSDTGIGISEKARAILFEPFTQADGSVTRKYGGTGLGLVIASRLVDLMKGQIGYSSIEGAGATFWFIVPLAIPRPAATSRPKMVKPAVMQLRSEKPILLVEDNPTNVAVTTHMLRTLGLQATAVENGRLAFNLLKDHAGEYALVLMDVHMPEMDGLSATRLVREHEAGASQHTTIIAFTAFAMSSDRDACLAAGMDDYISKPVTLSTLSNVLARWLPRADADNTNPPVC